MFKLQIKLNPAPTFLKKSGAWVNQAIKLGLLIGVFGLVLFGMQLTKVEAAAGINPQINYQGKLNNKDAGTAVGDQSWNFRFSIYDASTAGTRLWKEVWSSTSTQVSTVNGIFSVALGSITAFGTDVDFNSDSLYLQIDMDAENSGVGDGDWEEVFSDRKRLSATPYAFNADTVDGIHATSTDAVANYLLALDAQGNLDLFGQGVSSTRATTTNLLIWDTATATKLIATSYASTTKLILSDQGSDDTALDDVYVTGGNLFFNATQLTGAGGLSFWNYRAGLEGAISPTSTNAGIYITASSTIAANFRVDGSATTTGTFYVGGYTTTTGGLFTQGNLHIGGTSVFDGLISGSGFDSAWNSAFNSTSTWNAFGTNFDTQFNSTTTWNAFTTNWDTLFIATTTWTGFNGLFDTRLIATTTWAGNLLVDGSVTTTGIFTASQYASTTNLVLADQGSNLASLNDIYVSEGNLFYDAIQLTGSAGFGINNWQVNAIGQLTPTTTIGVLLPGNATTSGYFVIGTVNPVTNLSAGDLFVGSNATVTTNLFVGGFASTTNLVFSDSGSNFGGAPDLYVSGGNLFYDAIQLTGSAGFGINNWTVNAIGQLTPTTSIGVLLPSNATTSGYFVIGTNNPITNLNAGDLYVGSNATVTNNLFIGGFASTTNLVFSDSGSNFGGAPDLYVSSGNLFFDAIQLTGAAGFGRNDWKFGIANGKDFIRPTTTVDLFFPSRVGIGTSTPQALLSVSTSTGKLFGTSLLFQVASTTGAGISNSLVVTADGNVGIGDASPTQPLHVDSDINNLAINIQENSGAEDWQIGVQGNGNLVFADSESTTNIIEFKDDLAGMLIQADGSGSSIQYNVYTDTAGDDSFIALRHIRGSVTSPTATQDGDDIGAILFGGWDTALSTGASIQAVAAGEWGTSSDPSDNPTDLIFSTAPNGGNNTERLRITSGGNVGIGTSTPEFRLVVVKNIADDTVGNLLVLDSLNQGVGSGGAIQFQNDFVEAQIQMINSAANDSALAFFTETDGSTLVEQMRIEHNGNVGIGTTTPTFKLEVLDSAGTSLGLIRDDASIVSGNELGNLNFGGNDAALRTGARIQSLSAGSWSAGVSAADLRFFTTAAGTDDLLERMTISASGNVGIGTTTPSFILVVSDNSDTNIPTIHIADEDSGEGLDDIIGQIDFSSADSSSGLGGAIRSRIASVSENSFGSEHGLAFYTRTFATFVERMRISATGNVGIGVSAPTEDLHLQKADTNTLLIEDTSGNGEAELALKNDAVTWTLKVASNDDFRIFSGATLIFIIDPLAKANQLRLEPTETVINDGGDDLNFRVEAVGADNALFVEGSSGNVGIGTTNPATDLHILNSGASATVKIETGAGLDAILQLHGDRDWRIEMEGSFTDGFIIRDETAEKDRLIIETDGALIMDVTKTGIGTEGTNDLCWDGAGVSYWGACGSLAALKTNITDITFGWSEFNQLQPRSFNWKESGRADIGFVAEEINAVNPLYAEYSNNELSGVKYKKLTALLTAAVQDLKIQFDSLAVDNNPPSNDPITVIDNPNLDIDTLVVQQAATFYGTLYVQGEAGFAHKVVFEKDIEVKGKIYVSADQAGTATITANATSTKIVFNSEYEIVPKMVATLNDLITITYAITDRSTSGFTLSILESQDQDIAFDWIALGVKDDSLVLSSVSPVINSLTASREQVGFNIPVELWVQASDEDTDPQDLNYTWTFEPNIGSLDNPNSGLVFWRVAEGEVASTTDVIITVEVSDGQSEVRESVVVTVLVEGSTTQEPPAEEQPAEEPTEELPAEEPPEESKIAVDPLEESTEPEKEIVVEEPPEEVVIEEPLEEVVVEESPPEENPIEISTL